MNKILEEEERKALEAQHRQERNKRIADRLKAVLLHDRGWTDTQIAEALFISRTAVSTHIKEYLSNKKLKPSGGGSQPKLSRTQEGELEAHLAEHTYLFVKDIVAYVEKTYGVKYSVPGMRNWLQRKGFSHHKPAPRPGKVDVKAQEEFVSLYNKTLNQLEDEDELVFIDGVHPSHNTNIVAGWIKKGVRKEIPTNSGRKRLNILGALSLHSMDFTMSEHVTLNAESAIGFFKKLEARYPKARKIYAVMDGAPYFDCREVREFLEKSRIVALRLPAYSPNLNAIERLWRFMRIKILYNQYFKKFNDFADAILGFFKNLKIYKKELFSFITDDFQLFDPKCNF